ncbi:hypothetical protein DL767_002923 [Monosporascus sp. MG133]|nr:hypothetical protein DL767_002923 [Monosporascus sp. MG133]
MRPFRRPPSVNPTSWDAGCRLGVGPSMVKGFGVASAAWRLAWSANLIRGARRGEARQEAVEGVVLFLKVGVIRSSAGQTPASLQGIKVLTSDVFGTAVDWRSTVHEEPVRPAREKIDHQNTSVSRGRCEPA